MSSKTITKNDLKAILEGIDVSTGGGGAGVSEPTANTTAAFDNNAHINSTDMSTEDITEFVNSMYNANSSLAPLNMKTYVITTYPSGWEAYNESTIPTVYVFGNIGIFTGALKNTTTVTLNATDIEMFQLPLTVAQNCMSRHSWSDGTYHTRIDPEGKVYFARASNNGGTTYPSNAAGKWFPFTMVFPVKTINEAVFQTNYNVDLFYPVGSYYETSDSNFDPNIAWGGTWTSAQVFDGGKLLFNNSSQSLSGTITLSDSAVNYDKFEIICHSNDEHYISETVYSPNNKKVGLTYAVVNFDSTHSVWLKSKTLMITGTSINTEYDSSTGYYRTGEVRLGGTYSTTYSDKLGITQVIGYKLVNRWYRTA